MRSSLPVGAAQLLIASAKQDSALALAAFLQTHGLQSTTIDLSVENIETVTATSHNLVLIDDYELQTDVRPICQWLHDHFVGPVLLMTYETDERYHIDIYKQGVDEVISKSISLELLYSKIMAWLHRADLATHQQEKLCQHGFEINTYNRQVVTPHQTTIHLSKLEFELLGLFLNHPNHVLESGLIIRRIWFHEDAGTENMLKSLIHRLRHKIEPDLVNPSYIQTVPNIGYVFRP
jgi:two-component system, OmpR family, response regulator